MPKTKWADMESCVAKVKAKGKVKNPYAICYDSIMTADKLVSKKYKKK